MHFDRALVHHLPMQDGFAIFGREVLDLGLQTSSIDNPSIIDISTSVRTSLAAPLPSVKDC